MQLIRASAVATFAGVMRVSSGISSPQADAKNGTIYYATALRDVDIGLVHVSLFISESYS